MIQVTQLPTTLFIFFYLLNILDMPKIWMDVIDIQVNLELTNMINNVSLERAKGDY